MSDKSKDHNAAILPLLRLIVRAAPDEASQWVLLETLCLGVGKLHSRDSRQVAVFVESIAERFVEGAR